MFQRGNLLRRTIVQDVWLEQRHEFGSSTVRLLRGKERIAPPTAKEIERAVKDEKRGVFRVLDIGLPKPYQAERPKRTADRVVIKAPPRERQMKPDQDWTSVWPAAKTFHPAVVPLPIRQGMKAGKLEPTPSKWANAELMKIPNFLHLTPPTIQMHCEQLKQFCTEFPEELKKADEMELNLPLTEITTDYLNASSSVRDFRSRIVTLKFKLSGLHLDAHGRDKFLRLIGEDRYDYKSDTVTITSDRLPYRKQNRDYCEYLIKVLFHESNKTEVWEAEREDLDMHVYQLSADGSQENANEGDYDAAAASEYRRALQKVLNHGEDQRSLENYKSKVLQMLQMKDDLPIAAEKV